MGYENYKIDDFGKDFAFDSKTLHLLDAFKIKRNKQAFIQSYNFKSAVWRGTHQRTRPILDILTYHSHALNILLHHWIVERKYVDSWTMISKNIVGFKRWPTFCYPSNSN